MSNITAKFPDTKHVLGFQLDNAILEISHDNYTVKDLKVLNDQSFQMTVVSETDFSDWITVDNCRANPTLKLEVLCTYKITDVYAEDKANNIFECYYICQDRDIVNLAFVDPNCETWDRKAEESVIKNEIRRHPETLSDLDDFTAYIIAN